MDIDCSNESSSDGSGSSGSSYSEDMNVERDVNMIQPYSFEPNGFGIFVNCSDKTTRLQDMNW
jgi:hypothetical protein